ncbi:MAG: hypothetical protein HKN68_14915 [Saprospiraceae bacterium]|nr:hypothetical protein [Saprospiraceae bacterium]
MKNKFFILLFAGLLMTSCSEDVSLNAPLTDEAIVIDDEINVNALKPNFKNNGKAVTKPMKVKGDGIIEYNPYACSESQVLVEITGTGNATHMGKYDLYLSYCRSFNPTIPSTRTEGYQIAANGDKLLTRLLYDGVEDGLYFQMYEYYPGGTGRFANAEGWVKLFFEFTYNDDGAPVAYSNYGQGELTY